MGGGAEGPWCVCGWGASLFHLDVGAALLLLLLLGLFFGADTERLFSLTLLPSERPSGRTGEFLGRGRRLLLKKK